MAGIDMIPAIFRWILAKMMVYLTVIFCERMTDLCCIFTM